MTGTQTKTENKKQEIEMKRFKIRVNENGMVTPAHQMTSAGREGPDTVAYRVTRAPDHATMDDAVKRFD